ncbi:MAG TPA: hypothetical protein VIY30_06650 [Burkholderiaceae bacterium]
MRRAGVPADFRARLEQARLDTLALLRALDHGLAGHPTPAGPLAALAEADADCAEALWALEQPPTTLDLAAMVRDTTATLARLPRTRQQIRDALPRMTADRIAHLERHIRTALDPHEAYTDIPGHDPQNR